MSDDNLRKDKSYYAEIKYFSCDIHNTYCISLISFLVVWQQIKFWFVISGCPKHSDCTSYDAL